MKHLSLQRRTLALVAVLVTLFALMVYVAVRSGPLAPVAVTVAKVESRALTNAILDETYAGIDMPHAAVAFDDQATGKLKSNRELF